MNFNGPMIVNADEIDFEDELTQDQMNDFLAELTLLTLKHKVAVVGTAPGEPFLISTDGAAGRYLVDEDGEDLFFALDTMMQ